MEGELFRLGPIAIYSFGCALAAAFLVGTALVAKEATHRGMDAMWVVDLATRVILVGLVAGRIGYCLPDITFYLSNPGDFLRVSQGGLSYIPALLAALGYLYWHAKRNNLHYWALLDLIAPGMAAGLILGFLGAAEVQPTEGAFWLGERYWPPSTLAFFTMEYMGLWYLAASRRRLAPGRRFCQIVAFDAAARTISSGWAWVIYGDALPHALSVAAGIALFCGAEAASYTRKPVSLRPIVAQPADTAAAAGEGALHMPYRRKRLAVRDRVLRAVAWLGAYVLLVFLMGRTVV